MTFDKRISPAGIDIACLKATANVTGISRLHKGIQLGLYYNPAVGRASFSL